MESILNLGIAIILFLQGLGGWLLGVMKALTFLGNEEFFLFVAPAIYWCLDTALGLRIGLGLMISASLNSAIKIFLRGSRPYWYDARVQPYSAETSFGVPSGHSQNTVVVWGLFAAWLKRGWVWAIAILIMFLVGVSRMYLGVHFPHDVLLGWLIGALLVWALLRLEKPVVARLERYKPAEKALIALGFSLVLILLGAFARLTLGGYSVPAEWVQLSARAPEADPIAPLALSGLISNAGTFFGLALGAILIKARGGFNPGGPAWQRALRFLVGVVGVFLIWYGLGAIFPRGETLLPYLLRYLRYSLVGLWVTALAPMLFIRAKLAQKSG